MEPLDPRYCYTCRNEEVIRYAEVYILPPGFRGNANASALAPNASEQECPCPQCNPLDFAKWRQKERRRWFHETERGALSPDERLPPFLV